MAQKKEVRKPEKEEKKEPKGISLTMNQLITLCFVLAALFIAVGIWSWFSLSKAVSVNAFAIAAIALYIGIRAVLFGRKNAG